MTSPKPSPSWAVKIWEMWIDDLLAAGVLADGVQTVAYSYIGPSMTWPIYKNGTIGKAKEDLERVQQVLDGKLAALKGKAWVSVNKALVTQASSAIPVVPLYISLLYKVMKAEGTHEDTIEQMDRLFRDRLYNGQPQPDEAGRIRVDDWEMKPAVQDIIAERWATVDTESFAEIGDFAGYQSSFLRLFGFGLAGVDYDAETDTSIGVPSISSAVLGRVRRLCSTTRPVGRAVSSPPSLGRLTFDGSKNAHEAYWPISTALWGQSAPRLPAVSAKAFKRRATRPAAATAPAPEPCARARFG